MTNDYVELQRKHFNNISEIYIKYRTGKNHLAYKEIMWKFVLNKLADYLPKKSQMIGLEAMCGTAEASERIVNFFPNVKMNAFDLSESMIDAAEKRTGKEITIFQEDILKFEKKEAYDFIVIIGGLHHIPYDIQKGLQNIYNALKKDGIFLNLEPTHNNLLWKSVRENIYKTNAFFEESSERAFTLKEYNKNLSDNNFHILYQFYPGLLGYVLYYNPDAFPALNVGTTGMAKISARLDVLFGKSIVGRIFSFNTWTIASKQ